MTWSLDEIQSYIEEKESSLQFMASEGVKTCTACFETMPISDFGKRKGAKDGYNPQCRDCKNAKKTANDFDLVFGNLHLNRFRNRNVVTWYLEDTEGNFIGRNCTSCGKMKLIKEFHKETAGFKGYIPNCRRCHYNRHREYIRKNPNKVSEYQKGYHKENKSEIREHQRKYYTENKSEILEQRRKRYYENVKDPIWVGRNREANRKSYRKRYEQNPEDYKAKNAKRKARKHNLYVDQNFENAWVETRERSDNRCALSGDVIQKSECHLDHFIPLSSGHGGTYAGNCVPLRGDLNQSKGSKNPFEWFEEIKEREKLEQEQFDKTISDLAGWHDVTPEEYREYVYWCMENQRTGEQIKADNERYGRNGQPVSSVELFRMAKAGQYVCA